MANRSITVSHSSVGVADQMGVEIVQIGTLQAAAVAPPRIRFAVEPAMQKIQCLVWEGDVAMLALPVRV